MSHLYNVSFRVSSTRWQTNCISIKLLHSCIFMERDKNNAMKPFQIWKRAKTPKFLLSKVLIKCMRNAGKVFIRYSHISDNTTGLRPPPPKFCITFVFNFSWVLQSSHEKLKTMLKQNLKRANEVYYGRCAKANTNKELKARVTLFTDSPFSHRP